MGYSAKAIANYFIVKYGKYGLSPLKLQKLVYIAHGWYLALSDGEPLIDDEYAEAWQYGPVFPSLYYEFKDFGPKRITRKAEDVTFSDDEDVEFFVPEIQGDDDRTRKLLDRVWDVYRKFTAGQLSSLTHADGTPWHQVRRESPGMRNVHIPNELIRTHYEEKMAPRS